MVAGDETLALLDDGHVEAGAADIRMDDVFETGMAGQVGSIGHPACRPGFDQLLGTQLGVLRAHDAAVALEDEQLSGEAPLGQNLGQTVEVMRHDRHEAGADRGRREPAVLAEHRAGVRRHDDMHAGCLFEDDVAHLSLMRVVCIGVDEADPDRAIAARLDLARDRPRGVFLEFPAHFSLG